MKQLRKMLLPALLLSLPLSAVADSWKDHHRHGARHHSYQEEYWEGNCKVKRKMKKNGSYKEERKCKAPKKGYYKPARHQYQRAPRLPAYGPTHVPIEIIPGVRVHIGY